MTDYLRFRLTVLAFYALVFLGILAVAALFWSELP